MGLLFHADSEEGGVGLLLHIGSDGGGVGVLLHAGSEEAGGGAVWEDFSWERLPGMKSIVASGSISESKVGMVVLRSTSVDSSSKGG